MIKSVSHLRKNQYLGVNAHLNSTLQQDGAWDEFHSAYLNDLTRMMKEQLYPLGYTAKLEQGLQIRRIDEPPRVPEADILVLDMNPLRPFRPSTQPLAESGELVLDAPEMLGIPDETAHPYRAIGIYKQSKDLKPVAWIELLSPSNKAGGRHADAYTDKRQQVLESGVVFVEIDYLHEYPPTFPILPSYRPDSKELSANARPYFIAVIDPRPDLWEGKGRVIPFDVDTPIPTISIPLNAGDVLKFDFGIPYQLTFEGMLYGNEIDYAQLPVNFDHYREDDQGRIVSRMLAVLEAVEKGTNLEQPPSPVPCLPLEEAMKRWEKAVGN
jgi:hypothetical protein